MTPDQEILSDALDAARQRVERFRAELATHAKSLPLDPSSEWDKPSPDLEMEMAAFTKRYEMTQDLVTRRLFRSVLAVRGTKLRSKALPEVVGHIRQLGLIADAGRWDEITKLRNSFAHDYAISFAAIVPLLNQAWVFATDLIAMVETVDRYVTEQGLLDPKEAS